MPADANNLLFGRRLAKYFTVCGMERNETQNENILKTIAPDASDSNSPGCAVSNEFHALSGDCVRVRFDIMEVSSSVKQRVDFDR